MLGSKGKSSPLCAAAQATICDKQGHKTFEFKDFTLINETTGIPGLEFSNDRALSDLWSGLGPFISPSSRGISNDELLFESVILPHSTNHI